MKGYRFFIGLLATLMASAAMTTTQAMAASSEIKLVDLGLSVKWADMNIDADKATDSGGYYAWGETATKPTYTWANYAWCNGTEGSCQNIGSDISGNLKYDRAKKYSAKMCLPTTEQWDELISLCTWKETTVDGVKGYIVTGPNGNTIFLPFSGCSYDGKDHSIGSSAYYWTANNVSGDNSKGRAAYINKGEKTKVSTIRRRTGAAIRAVASTAPSGNQYALYNYRNDGKFNAWINIDIDSITFSRVDTLGVEHDEVVVQEVWTPDSLYRIPLEAIDSIGFRAPTTKYKPGIFIIEEKHLPYIVTADDGSVTFKKGTSADMMPKKGQIMYSDLVETPFYMGFAGRVVEIENTSAGIKYVCESVSPDEVYDRYVNVFKIVSDSTEVVSASEMVRHGPYRVWGGVSDTGIITIPDLRLDFSSNLNKWTKFKGDVKVKGKVSNTIEYVINVGGGLASFVNIKHAKKLTWSLQTSYKIDEADTEDLCIQDYMDEPIYTFGSKYLGLNIYVGLFFDVKANLEFIAKFPVYESTHVDEYYFGSDLGWNNPLVTSNSNSTWSSLDDFLDNFTQETELKMKFSGAVSFGPVIKSSFQVWKPDFLSFDVRLKGGFELGGECALDLLELVRGNDAIYKMLSEDTKITSGLKVGLELHGTVLKDKDGIGKDCNWFSPSMTLFKREHYLFPRFTQPHLPEWIDGEWEGGVKPLSVFSVPSNNLLLPGKVGLAVFDESGNRIITTYGDIWFFGGDWEKSWLQSDISTFDKGKTYVIRPFFNMLNIGEVLASPSSMIRIPDPMTLNINSPMNSVTLRKGQELLVAINDGWGDFSVTSSVESLCSGEIIKIEDKHYVKIVASKYMLGPAEITVKDLRSGKTEAILVSVTDEDVTSLQLSTNTLTLTTGQQSTVDVTSGSGSYVVKSSNKNVATATREGSKVTVTAVAVGSAVITVKDQQTNETADIQVTVSNNGPEVPNLQLSASSITLTPGQQGTVDVTSGSGSYVVKSSNNNVATATREGSKVTITAVAVGTAVITVKDQQTNQTADIQVTVSNISSVQTETFTVNGVSFTMIAVEGGTFWMGAEDVDSEADWTEHPRHQVTLSSFSIGQTEVTQELWEAVMGMNPSYFEGANRPVEEVSWDDCQTFIAELNAMTGKIFRLPTEAEWEYAARGGKYSHGYKYAGSNDVDAVAWYENNAEFVPDPGTRPVAQKQPNELGLYDMSGNVDEWCQDYWNGWYYYNSPSTNPCNTDESDYHVIRGGDWHWDSKLCRVVHRDHWKNKYYDLGMRLALSDIGSSQEAYLTCPDGNHPHLIELGLPSGTKWACCNVDDEHSNQSPTNYGSYYAWGETKGKDVYNESTYKYYQNGSYVSLGSDISGTEFDVAHVKWGDNWVMPTHDEQVELLNNCNSEWTTENGVDGRRFTSKVNGGTIFLPRCGLSLVRRPLLRR